MYKILIICLLSVIPPQRENKVIKEGHAGHFAGGGEQGSKRSGATRATHFRQNHSGVLSPGRLNSAAGVLAEGRKASQRLANALMSLDILVLIDTDECVVTIKRKNMPMAPVVAAAGLNTIGNLFNVGSQALTNAKNRRWSEKMFNWQNNTNITNWAMENEYNSPANQMKRLKEAGLNPALVYGGGASAQGGSIGSSSPPGKSGDAPQVDMSGIIQSFIELSLLDKRKDLLQAQTEAQRVHADLTASEIPLREQDLKQKQILAPHQLTALELSNKKAQADIEKTHADTTYTLDQNERAWAMQAPTIQKALEEILTHRKNRARTDAEIRHINQQIENLKSSKAIMELDIELKEKGIQPNAPWYVQLIARLLGGKPKSEEQIKKEVDGIKREIRTNKF